MNELRGGVSDGLQKERKKKNPQQLEEIQKGDLNFSDLTQSRHGNVLGEKSLDLGVATILYRKVFTLHLSFSSRIPGINQLQLNLTFVLST